jgi:hypothetical protein
MYQVVAKILELVSEVEAGWRWIGFSYDLRVGVVGCGICDLQHWRKVCYLLDW